MAENSEFLEPVAQVAQVAQENDKAGIAERDAEDWQTYFDERASIAEHDGGLSCADAEQQAFECCIVEWLNRHLHNPDPGRCAWCEKPDRDGHAIVPFGTESHGHTWLHPECWIDWSQHQRERAQRALADMGLDAPPKCAKSANFPEDFGKNGGE